MKTTLLFSGQGAQAVGMGKDLYENFAIAKECFDEAESILNTPFKKICFEGPDEDLRKTENTQPAVLIVSYILAKLLENEGITIDAFAGFSLGEYSALTASGVIDFNAAIKLVQQRGLIMEKAVPNGKGGMAAILGLEDEQVEEVCRNTDGIVVPANYNCPMQLVISGEKEAVEKACALADEKGAMRSVILNVSGPFHSPLLKDASTELKSVLDGINFNPLNNKKVMSNVTADYHTEGNIKDLLKQQMYSPVKWTDSIRKLISDGYDTFIEVGPGRVLTGFMRSIDRTPQAISIRDAKSLEQALETLKK